MLLQVATAAFVAMEMEEQKKLKILSSTYIFIIFSLLVSSEEGFIIKISYYIIVTILSIQNIYFTCNICKEKSKKSVI